VSDPVTRFQKRYMSYGDWLGEWMCGFIMVAVMSGIISVFSDYGLSRAEATAALLILTFLVNTAWGLIDGFSSMYGGLTDTADQERLIEHLKGDSASPELRGALLSSLGSGTMEYLTIDEKEKVLDRIIAEAPAAKTKYAFSRDYRNTLIATASCDILAVIPVVLPFLILGFSQLSVGLSRVIASVAVGAIVFSYAKHTGRHKWLAATLVTGLMLVVTAVAYYFGW
jgi:VIT1/CCC1 family predicted Fe2+/Mn2+ transporter